MKQTRYQNRASRGHFLIGNTPPPQLIINKNTFCTIGETIVFCATKKTGLPTVIWLVAKKLNFEFQKLKNDDNFNFISHIFSVLQFSYVIDKIFSNFMSKLKNFMQQFQLKNSILRQYSWFSKIQMKLQIVSDQFHWNYLKPN